MKKKNWILVGAATAALALFIFGAAGLLLRQMDYRQQENLFNELRRVFYDTENVTEFKPTMQLMVDENTANAMEGHNLAALIERNTDCRAWLSIPGTEIDYPVMHTPRDPECYLRRNYEGEYSVHGVPFLDARCDPDLSSNLIIYGHNMSDGTMFAPLLKYLGESYCSEHPYIYLETSDSIREYRVAAVVRITGSYSPSEWSLFNNIDLSGEELKTLATELSSKGLYNTGQSIMAGDRLLTLVTCEYSKFNGRLAVVAVEI